MMFKLVHILVILLVVIGQTNVLSNVNQIVANSQDKQLGDNNSISKGRIDKFQTPPSPPPPPLVEVIHGKVNSVIHDIVGSIDDPPPLVTDAVKPKMEFVVPTHTTYSSNVPPELAENENVSSIETILEHAVLQSTDLVENATQPSPSQVPEEIPSEVNKDDKPAVPKLKDEKVQEQKPQEMKIEQKTEPIVVSVPSIPEQKEVKEESNTTSHDDIPSFSEWAKKQMAEVGKNKGENLTVGIMKLRGKNYASPDCGAKVVAANPEAVSPGAILSPSRDDYMLNACNVKIWFVVELCESIQPQRVEIANFELFSSSPQDLSIWVSDRHPTRDWNQVASVQAKDERTVQSFSLPPLPTFAKYVKVELHSHYGSEHYCPISLFKAYGASELEVLDHEDAGEEPPDEEMIPPKEEQAEEEEDDIAFKKDEDKPVEEDRNFLSTAKAAVLSVVKKAAEVLVVRSKNSTCSNVSLSRDCFTPSYAVICSNCSEKFYDRLFDVMCCQGSILKSLLLNRFVYSVIMNSTICTDYGFDWFQESNPKLSSNNNTLGISYLKAFLNDETIAALCNYVAITKKKTPLNVSQEKLPDASPLVEPSVNEPQPPSAEGDQLSDPVTPDIPTLIHPTKTLPEENTTAPEISTNQTVGSDTQTHSNDSSINKLEESNESESTEPTPFLENEKLPTPDEKNDTLAVNNTLPLDVVQPTPSQDDPVTVDSLALDSLFPDLEEEQQTQDLEASTTKATMSLKVQKESVFVRLANRIKALEMNMSLSGQYLEELSRRYKKQVEELQRSLANVMEERRIAAERESKQAVQLAVLTSKVETLTSILDQLLEDRNHWGSFSKAYFYGHHGVIIAFEVIMLFVVIGLCRWFTSTHSKRSDDPPKKHGSLKRRHSLDHTATKTPAPKARRPSEEAFIPSSSTHQDLLIESEKRKISKDHLRKKKKKKKEKYDDGEIVTIGALGEEIQSQPPAPEFIRTAAWARRQRASIQTQTSSSQETLSSIAIQSSAPPSLNSSIKKKTGAFKKIVKKLF